MPARSEPVVDGRRARRERGRMAVTEAMIDLVMDGHVPPSTDQIAERAGVSASSLFRYFETLDDLRRATTALYFERYADLFGITDIGEGSLAERIERFVGCRVKLHETIEPMARLARWRANDVDQIDETLHLVRATRVDQIRQHFDAEFCSLTPANADDLAMIVATLTSFESWDQATHDHHRSPAQIRRAWNAALIRILS
jgi:AcrR family transcriptional regulator